MKTHEQLHLGIKPFKCPVEGCEKSFTQLGNLKVIEINSLIKSKSMNAKLSFLSRNCPSGKEEFKLTEKPRRTRFSIMTLALTYLSRAVHLFWLMDSGIFLIKVACNKKRPNYWRESKQ